MEIILREHVEHLGRRGDIVSVADGYARNYLLPRKLALPATAGNKKRVQHERKILEVAEAEERQGAELVAERLAALEVVVARRVGENDTLYGFVTAADIGAQLDSAGCGARSPQDPARRAAQGAGGVRCAGQAPS